MELFRALAVLIEPPMARAAPLADALELGVLPDADAYTEFFVFQLYPYASVYLGAEGMLGGEARDRVAGFWRALGQTPPGDVDYLPVMLALYARLCELEKRERDESARGNWRRARKTFLWEHLLSWLPVYLSKVSEIAPAFYRRWGEVLSEALLHEASEVGGQQWLPLHLRETTHGLADPRSDGGAAFLSSLLSPVRSGMILVRADFARAARSLGLGLRIGERNFILKALLSQDARGMLGWLREEATGWAERHRVLGEQQGALGDVAQAWEQRAKTSATLLEELGQAAGEVD